VLFHARHSNGLELLLEAVDWSAARKRLLDFYNDDTWTFEPVDPSPPANDHGNPQGGPR
jgi:hypothetical protein